MQQNRSMRGKMTKLCKPNGLHIIVCAVLLMIVMTACNSKVTTVADDITARDGQEPQYVEIDNFELDVQSDDTLENVGSCAILIPEGFTESTEIPGMYISTIYPLDASNIYYSVMDAKDIGMVNSDLNASDYEATMESSFRYINKPVDIIVDNFEKSTLDGVPCYKIRSHYDNGDLTVQQLCYIVIATKTHVITYTQASDDELLVDFKTDEGNIKVVREVSQA